MSQTSQKVQKHLELTATTRAACFLALAVVLSLAILFLFPALTYSQITLPKYATEHPLKDAQQVTNLCVAIVAAVIGIFLSHCLR